MAISTYLSIIKCIWTKCSIQKTEWLNTKITPTYAAYKRLTCDLKTHTDWKWGDGKGISCKWKLKRAGVALLNSDKIDFKTKTERIDKDGHYIIIEGSIQQEDITTVNIYAPNIRAPQYIRQILSHKGRNWQ